MKQFDYEVAVDFGFNYKYYIVRASSEKEAKQIVWKMLNKYIKNDVISMEITVKVTGVCLMK